MTDIHEMAKNLHANFIELSPDGQIKALEKFIQAAVADTGIWIECEKLSERAVILNAQLQDCQAEAAAMRAALEWIEMDTRDPTASNSRSNERARAALDRIKRGGGGGEK